MNLLVVVDERAAQATSLLEAVSTVLAPVAEMTIIILANPAPLDTAEQALEGLVGRGPARERARRRLEQASDDDRARQRAELDDWLERHGRTADVVELNDERHPEHRIVELARQRPVDLIVVAAGTDRPHSPPPPPPPHGPGKHRHGPDHRGKDKAKPPPHSRPHPPDHLARFVIDHAPCPVLVWRGE